MKKITALLLLLFAGWSLFAQNATLDGRVVDSRTGNGLDFASVRIGQAAGTNTDEKGKFSLSVPAGTYEVVVTYVGYDPQTRNLELAPGEKLTLIFKLVETGSVLGPVVISSSQFEKKLEEEVVSMDVVDEELFKNNNATDLGEAVDKGVGVQVQDGQISMRGGSSWSYGVGSRTAVLVDNLSFQSADLQTAQLKSAPLENADQIEIIKGASSVIYGSSALNGVVNVRTGWPSDVPKTEIQLYQGVYGQPPRADLQWWEKWETPSFSGAYWSHQRQIGDMDLIVGGNLNKRNSYLLGDDEFRFRSNFKTRYRHPKIQGLTFGVNGNSMYERSAAFFLPIDLDTAAYEASDFSTDRYIRTNIDPHFEYVNENGMRHRVLMRWMNVFRYGNNDDPNAISHYFSADYQAQKRWGDDTNHVVLTAGIPVSYGTATSNLYPGRRVITSGAAYAQLEWKRDRLTLMGGTRYEFNSVDTNYAATIPVFRSGLNYRAGKATFLRASLGQAYRLPSVGERYVDQSFYILRIFPNPDLLAERGWGAEIGIKQGMQIDKWKGYVDLSLFWNEYQDFVEYRLGLYPPEDSIGQVNPLDYIGMKPFNVENARVAGFELEGLGMGNIGPVELRLLGGYTYNYPGNLQLDSAQRNVGVYMQNFFHGMFNRYEYPVDVDQVLTNPSDSGSVLNFRTRHLVKGDVEAFYQRFSVGYTVFYASFPEKIPGLYYIALPNLQSFVDAHQQGDWVHGIRASYTLPYKNSEEDFMKVSLIIKNLLNREYAQRPGKLDAPRNATVQLRFFF